MKVLDTVKDRSVNAFEYSLGNFWNQDRKDIVMNKGKPWNETWSKPTCCINSICYI